MIALGIIAIVLFAISLFAFGWLSYIGIIIGIIGITGGHKSGDKIAMVLGILGTALCAITAIVMTVWYVSM